MIEQSAGEQLRGFSDRLLSSLKEAVEKAAVEGVKNSLPGVREGISKSFHDAMKEFYDDYTPNSYDRGYTLYNVLKIDGGNTDRSFHFWFDPEEIPFRDGSIGLYEQVFEKGWHGGADHIAPEKEDRWGVHPRPGTPLTRFPLRIWNRWYDDFDVKISDPPPEENAYIHFNRYAETEGVDTVRTYVNDAIQDALFALIREVS